jgi:hypothetical protein
MGQQSRAYGSAVRLPLVRREARTALFAPAAQRLFLSGKHLCVSHGQTTPRFFIIYSNSYLEKCKVFVKSSIEKREKI